MADQIKKTRGTRTGFTTGACAAAAARGAVLALVQQAPCSDIETLLPNGQTVRFALVGCHLDSHVSHAEVIKDAGDDPDVTDKAHICADIALLPQAAGSVEILGGDGVGRVTLPGLGLEVGGPAINPVPRHNIEANVRAVAAELLQQHGLRVTISVPGGALIAQRTLNARLGILGGISILGTSGIVHPWSTKAFRASVEQGIDVTARRHIDTVVLTTGGRTERFAMAQLPDLPEGAFVQMGDFLKPALDRVVARQIPHVVIGGMVGKLTKMAQGESITHAGRNPVNMGVVAEIAAAVGAPAEVVAQIRAGITARYAAEQMAELGLSTEFYQGLARRVVERLRCDYHHAFSLRVLVCDFEGQWLAEYGEPHDNR